MVTTMLAPYVEGPTVFGVPLDFILFGLTLLGVAVFHHYTLRVALTGLVTIALYKIIFTGFKTGPGAVGFLFHLEHEWVVIVNLFCLLTGFAILSRHFEKSHVPVVLPKFLPSDWKGAFALFALVWFMSAFLDNIASALIGGAMAHQLFRAKVHIGYLAAIVAASNAGGAFSVVGDTTTTMMWIAASRRAWSSRPSSRPRSPSSSSAFRPRSSSRSIRPFSPILTNTPTSIGPGSASSASCSSWPSAPTSSSTSVSQFADHFPFIGVAVWVAIVFSVGVRRPDWEVLPEAMNGSIFLLALVLCASMMPVEKLPFHRGKPLSVWAFSPRSSITSR